MLGHTEQMGIGVESFFKFETYVSKRVAKVAVRVVQRDFERVSKSGLCYNFALAYITFLFISHFLT
jgi:hypothetical protein